MGPTCQREKEKEKKKAGGKKEKGKAGLGPFGCARGSLVGFGPLAHGSSFFLFISFILFQKTVFVITFDLELQIESNQF